VTLLTSRFVSPIPYLASWLKVWYRITAEKSGAKTSSEESSGMRTPMKNCTLLHRHQHTPKPLPTFYRIHYLLFAFSVRPIAATNLVNFIF
jgi:hypothetical protein